MFLRLTATPATIIKPWRKIRHFLIQKPISSRQASLLLQYRPCRSGMINQTSLTLIMVTAPPLLPNCCLAWIRASALAVDALNALIKITICFPVLPLCAIHSCVFIIFLLFSLFGIFFYWVRKTSIPSAFWKVHCAFQSADFLNALLFLKNIFSVFIPVKASRDARS